MKNLTIRKLTEADVTAIAGIHTAITRTDSAAEFKHLTREGFEKDRDASFVAEFGDRVVGYMIGHILSGGFGIRKSAWIAMFGVHPDCMGQGVGEALADHMFAYSRKRNIANVYTSVRWDSPDLLSFFKRLGFEKSNFINLLKRL